MDKTETLNRIIEHALPNVPFDGWSDTTIEAAARQAGINLGELIRATPGGIIQIIDQWMLNTDHELHLFAMANNLSALKIRERIAALVMYRLEILLPHREAVRRTVSYLLLPWNLHQNLKLLHRTVDLMWQLAGDTSTDYNWYTKRILLAGVYSSTLIVWLNDGTPGLQTTRDFLKRRIENVLAIGKLTMKKSA